MKNIPASPAPGYCPCGALCDRPSITRCQKCRVRLRWYRRKAWRIKSDQGNSGSHPVARRRRSP